MTNNNLADISAFEQLQNGQNERMCISSLSVFNDVGTVKSAVQKYADLVSEESLISADLGAAKKELDRLSNARDAGFTNWDDRDKAINQKKQEVQKLESRTKQLESSVKQQFETVKQEIKRVGESWIQSNDLNIHSKEWNPLVTAVSEPLRGNVKYKDAIKTFQKEADRALDDLFKKKLNKLK